MKEFIKTFLLLLGLFILGMLILSVLVWLLACFITWEFILIDSNQFRLTNEDIRIGILSFFIVFSVISIKINTDYS